MPIILDFHIKPKKKSTYSLQIFERGSSQPLINTSFDYDLSYITQFEINRLEPDPKDPHARLQRLTEFGSKLYKKLFTPDVQKLFSDFKQKTDFLVLCLRIAPKADQLEVLSWETLYDGAEFIAAGAKTGLSRLPLDIKIQDDLPALASPLKMLALMSSPLDLKENERLQIEKEQEILLQAVNSPSGQGKLHLEFEDEAKLPIVESGLEGGCHILHYSGHGIPPQDGGGLLLEDQQGNKRPTAVAELLQTLQKAEKDLRLTVISGCQTARTLNIAGFRDLARGLLRRKIPAVIAMQFSISDAAGLKFAESLYPRLIEGQMLDMAVSASRRALLLNDDVRIKTDAFAPVLFVSNSQPLKTKQAEKDQVPVQPKIDFSILSTLPKLEYGFYGRRREYRAIRDGLLHKNQRAIVVYGIGGIGKTALVSYLAWRLQSQFRGLCAFDCRMAALAPETILLELHRYLERQGITTLGQLLHQSIPPDQLATFIAQVLSQLSLLIIFDNFETHLRPTKTTVHEITDENLSIFLKTLIKTTAQNTRFLFTTRYLFDLDTKRIGTIAELPLGDLSRPEALGLMQKLPHLSSASFDEKVKAFDTFGGHPYALVTLDRHCLYSPLPDVLQDASKVHAELREFLAIELSYAKLSNRSRQLLNRLAAFRKPVPPDAAEWVIGEKIDEEIVAIDFFKLLKPNSKLKKLGETEFVKKYKADLPEQRHAKNIDKPITELIAWGLVIPLEDDGQFRALAVHSLVRDFSRDKQNTETWKKHLRDAAAYYTNRTKLLPQDDKSPTAVWNDMEAFELLFEAQEFEGAASLLIVATPLLDRWGFGRYRESLYNRIIPKVQRNQQGVLIGNLGILYYLRGDYESALAQYEKAIKILEDLGDQSGVSALLHEIAMIHQARGDYDKALQHYEKSLKIKQELGNRAGVSKSLLQIGMIHQERGDYDKALQHYEKSLKIAEDIGDRACVSSSLHQIGNIHYLRGDYDRALQQYEKSLKIDEDLGDRAGVSRSLHQIGMIHQARSDYDKALQQYEKSLKIDEDLGDRDGIAHSQGQIGKLFTKTKRYPQALENLLFALTIFAELQSPDVRIAVNHLKHLRELWGPKNFDKAFKEKTGEDVPDALKQKPVKSPKTNKKQKHKKTTKSKTKKKAKKTPKTQKSTGPNKTPPISIKEIKPKEKSNAKNHKSPLQRPK